MHVSGPLYAELWGFVAFDPAVLDAFALEHGADGDVLAVLQADDESAGGDLGDLACAEGVAVPLLGVEPPARYRFGVRSVDEAPWIAAAVRYERPGWVLRVTSGVLVVTSLGSLRTWGIGSSGRSRGEFVAIEVEPGWYTVTVRAGADPDACVAHPFAFELVLEPCADKPALRADVTADYAFS